MMDARDAALLAAIVGALVLGLCGPMVAWQIIRWI